MLELPRGVHEQDINEKNSRARYKARNKSVPTSSYPFYRCLISFTQLHLLRLKIDLSSSESKAGLLSFMVITGTDLD